MINSRAWMIGILLIMAVICSSALALVNYQTAPIIQRNNEIAYMSTVLNVFGIGFDSKNPEATIETYNSKIVESDAGGQNLFTDKDSGATAVSLAGSGFQGSMSFVVALDGDTITGFKVVSQVETPGLGARITEDEFQNSFIGKKVSKGITMTKSSAGISEFDAITGATETSRALETILNSGFTTYFSSVK